MLVQPGMGALTTSLRVLCQTDQSLETRMFLASAPKMAETGQNAWVLVSCSMLHAREVGVPAYNWGASCSSLNVQKSSSFSLRSRDFFFSFVESLLFIAATWLA